MCRKILAMTMAAGLLLLAGCGDSEKVIGGDVVNVTTGSRYEESAGRRRVQRHRRLRQRQQHPGATCSW